MSSAPTDAERLEALSRRYSPDCFRIRQLTSGRWAVFGPDHDLIGCASDFTEVSTLTAHLRLAAEVGRQRLASELAANTRRAAERSEVLDLDLSEIELDLDL